MKKPFRHRLPGFLGRFLRRSVVRLVGACVYVVGDLLDIAVGNGLDLDPLWPRELDNVEWPWGSLSERRRRLARSRGARAQDEANPAGAPPPLNVSDFFMMLDAADGAGRSAETAAEFVVASIIIPVFNGVDYTFQCLRSLMREFDPRRHEIIVVNDGSTDDTARLLSHLRAVVRAVEVGENRGFVHACNAGAAQARGKYLVFLNNDTVVRPGWLESLVRTAEEDSSVGAVGSMLLHPDGSLQEAGGIIWRNGSGWNYGRGEDPDESKYRYAREVDYCGGASLLVRKTLFEKLGGFDARYAPAYYEDVDLCFGVRALGFKVVCQPQSQLVHYEGGTAGTDLQGGFKQYQTLNRPKFVAKWREVLEREHLEESPDNVERAAHRRGGPRVVVFDEMFASPTGDAGSLRMLAILRALARQYRPVFVSGPAQLPRESEDLLGASGVEVARLPDYKQRPAAYADFLKGGDFSVALLSRPAMADRLLPLIRASSPETKIIYDTVDVHFLRLGREYELTGDEGVALEAQKMREQETRLASLSDQVWCVTPADEEVLGRETRASGIKIIPIPYSPQGRGAGFDERHGLLFIGNFNHSPNRDAVHYFVREVFPVVRAALPGVKFYVVGNRMTDEIAAHNSEDVVVKGYVPDVGPLFDGCRVFVAPLRFGAGLKGKIVQALSYGLPTVTTPVGAEGIGIGHRREAMIADTAEEFAAAVVELYNGRELWQRMSDAGYEHVRGSYAPEIVETRILAAVRELCEPAGGAPSADGDGAPAAQTRAGHLSFRCNICGQRSTALTEELGREARTCRVCGSTVRWRAVVHALSTELFGESLALPDFPVRRDIRGVGMSDWVGYAVPLAQKLDYTNTYLHQEPRLDITDIPEALEASCDFVISSDVFEHVPPPVSAAFRNLRRLLKPGGVLVFTAPYSKSAETVEHFPELYDYRLSEANGRRVLENTTREGVRQTFDNLVFRGSQGATLEMRLFSESSLVEEFRRAGFGEVRIHRGPDWEHGIFWRNECSLPMSVRAG